MNLKKNKNKLVAILSGGVLSLLGVPSYNPELFIFGRNEIIVTIKKIGLLKHYGNLGTAYILMVPPL